MSSERRGNERLEWRTLGDMVSTITRRVEKEIGEISVTPLYIFHREKSVIRRIIHSTVNTVHIAHTKALWVSHFSTGKFF
jgi:imidazole glycerol phosphate synthase subunit HisF